MEPRIKLVEAWIAGAREKLAAGTLTAADLDRLAALAGEEGRNTQRLLYLHAREPSVTSQVIAWAEHPGEDPGGTASLDPPYATVMEAIAGGWRAIHFPQQLAPFDDRETDIAGYEFILER